MGDQELRSTLSAFVPRTLWPTLAGEGGSLRLEGGALFADVAGFTPLTESLAKIGKEGAEELTRILNGFFSAMVDVVHGEGGDVLRFAGDAMTVFFPEGAEAALRAAVRMQEAARSFESIPTRAGTFSLGMKIGISSGTLLLGTAGDSEVGRDYFAAGRCLDLSAEAEHHASRGQIALCPVATLRLPRAASGVDLLPDGFAVIADPATFSAPPSRGRRVPEGPTEPPLDRLVAFLPAFIAEKARASHGVMQAEHRRTTVLFLTFSGIDYDGDESAPEKVGAVYAEIAREAGRQGGWINKLDMGDKGSKAIVLFGAPRALEHQEERACRTALSILENQTLRASLADLRIGITVAPLFAAYVGSDERREYTVMGDGINMAARLMANAHPWRVLCSREVMEQSPELSFRELDPIFVKGKAEKVAIFRPEGEKEASEERSRFVGRGGILGAEVPALVSPTTPVALALSGDAGVGKSALLHRLGHALDDAGVRRISVPLVAHSVQSHLAAWRPVLFSCLGVSRAAPPHIREGALRLAMAQEDEAYLPLFNALLELDLPEEEATKALSAKDRKDVLFAMLTRLVMAQVQTGPYGLFFDPLDYADPASLELLQAVLGEAGDRPLKVVAAHRSPASEGLKGVVASLRSIPVAPFTREETAEYLLHVAGMAVPSDTVVDFLQRKTGGNPKFLEQILAAMRRDGLAAPGPSGLLEVDEDRLASASFPDTLEGLLLARVDALPEGERTLLKAASVLGPSFSLNLLQTLLDQPQSLLVESILSLEGRGIIRMDTWGARPYATFADTLLRDALYESLNFSVKRAFHLRVAELLEEEGRDEPRLWPALARHYEAAESAAKASHYLWNTAEEARARFDNTTAFGFLSRFVALGEKTGSDPKHDAQFRKGLLYLAEASKELGRLEETDRFCDRLVTEVVPPTAEVVSAYIKLADNRRRRGDPEGALQTYAIAGELADALGDRTLQMQIISDSGVPLAMMGRFDEAMERFRRAEKLARKLKAHSSLVYALMNQGLCEYHGKGDYAAAAAVLKKAERVAKSSAQRGALIQVSANLAQVMFDLGEYKRALKVAKEGSLLARQFGLRNWQVQLMSNSALYLSMLGDWEGSREVALAALQLAEHHKMAYFASVNLATLGTLDGVEGRPRNGLASLRKALLNFREMKAKGEAIGTLSEIFLMRNAWCLHEEGEGPEFGAPELTSEDVLAGGPPWSVGLATQWLRYQVEVGVLASEQGIARLRSMLEQSEALKAAWLVAETVDALLSVMVHIGATAEAATMGGLFRQRLSSHFCPLKVLPLLLTTAEIASRCGEYELLSECVKTLKRYRSASAHGLFALRYSLLLSHWQQLNGRQSQARASTIRAQEVSRSLIENDPDCRTAVEGILGAHGLPSFTFDS